MSDDADYVANRRSGSVYVSKAFSVGHKDQHEGRFVVRVFDEGGRSRFDSVEGEIVVRATHKDKVQIKAVITTDDHKVRQLILQSFRIYKDGARPNQQFGISLRGEEISRLLDFLGFAATLQPTNPGRLRLDENSLAHLEVEPETLLSWLKRNPGALERLVAHQVTSKDVVAVAYRRRQLETFEKLLNDQKFFDQTAEKRFGGKHEALWQAFFEKNRWIFGYGLFHLSAEGFDNRKLEQIVAGATVASKGKRIDALLRTRGRANAVCLVEIKSHRAPLVKEQSYRSGAWQPSPDVVAAVAQALASVDLMEQQFQRVLRITDESGDPTGENVIIARPRAVVVCGSLTQFDTEHGVSDRFRAFELYRRHLISPDVITFDEVFERARLVVETDGDQ